MNTQNTTKRVVLAARPVGKPKGTDFRLEEVPVPDPGAGQLLLRTRTSSPTMPRSATGYWDTRQSPSLYRTPAIVPMIAAPNTTSRPFASESD
jgi:NADPH-dependent curcumin reductase CurA